MSLDALGDDAVEAGPFEAVEPVLRGLGAIGAGRDVGGRLRSLEELFEARAALAEGRLHQVVGAFAEHIEGDERRRRLFGQHPDARFRRVDAQLEGFEFEAVLAQDDDFAIEHARAGQRRRQRLDQLGEVAPERFQVARLEVGRVRTVEGDDAAEAIPLRLIEPAIAVRDLRREFGEHRRDFGFGTLDFGFRHAEIVG